MSDEEWWRQAFEHIPEENIIRLPDEAYEELLKMLDAPPRANDRLVELLKRRPLRGDHDGT